MKQYKPRDKITQKMTRDGLIEVNETATAATHAGRDAASRCAADRPASPCDGGCPEV